MRNMEKLEYQLHDIGIYIDIDRSEKWNHRVHELIRDQFDGFDAFINEKKVRNTIHFHNIEHLKKVKGTVVVPGQSCFYDEGIVYSQELNIAYKITDNKDVDFWLEETTWFAPYLIEQILALNSSSFVHGAGISVRKNEESPEGVLILAFGGIGKTCFISEAMKLDDVKLLGDDLIILNDDGTMMAYPRPFCVYPYHRELFAEYFKNHSYKVYHVKNSQYFLRGIRKIKSKLGIPLRISREYMCISPIRIYGSKRVEVERVPINKVYVMRRMVGIDTIQCRNFNDVIGTANFAQNVLMHELGVGLRVLNVKNTMTF